MSVFGRHQHGEAAQEAPAGATVPEQRAATSTGRAEASTDVGEAVGTRGEAAGTRRETFTPGYVGRGDSVSPEEMEHFWVDRTRIFLTPVAGPSILGLFGFMGATVMVGAWMAGWYGNPTTPFVLWPFAFTFGGVAQFLAAMWSYRARDGLATAMHGLWGTFWLAFGIITLLAETGVAPPLVLNTNVSFAWWFIVLASITMMGALAAIGDNLGIFSVMGVLAAASSFAAIGFYSGGGWAFTLAGWLFVVSAAAAWYTASAMMLAESFGRTILPLGRWRVSANVPGMRPARPMEYPLGMPGAKVGQ